MNGLRRRRLLAGVAAVGLAAGLALPGRPARRRPPPPPPVVRTGPPSAPAGRRPSPAGPRAVSRAFIAAYVGFVYRQLAAAQVPGASAEVRRRLAGLRPDPAPAVLAAADPRLRSLRVGLAGGATAVAIAVIEDRASVYRITLVLGHRPSGWTVTGLTETG